MSEISEYLSDNILDHVLRDEEYTPPTDLYLALYDGDPLGEGENEGTEVDSDTTNYAREIITFSPATNKEVQNGADVDFPEATGENWGDITHIAVFDSATGGEILFAGALDNPRTVYEGDVLRFQADEIQIILD